MIVYKATKAEFADQVRDGDIGSVVETCYKKATGEKARDNELQSWRNSLMYMHSVLDVPEIPDDAGVAIEYTLPQMRKRIDFVISGEDEAGAENVVIVELKQWSTAERTDMDGIVRTRFGKGMTDTNHPSYQAWSYASLLQGFNTTVYEEAIGLWPCAYCHNYERDGELDHPIYEDYVRKAPLFLRDDKIKLRDFIKRYVKYGDTRDVIYRIENGKIRPSKSLADALKSMLKGNDEFVMIDDQKVVFERALSLADRADTDQKHVLIVEGGPGTGKSVVAVNLLVALTSKAMNARYVTRNSAPREVYENRLVGSFKKTMISNLFTGSGSFQSAAPSEFDVLIVDEAHRLNEKSGLYKNLGENQIMEIIRASNLAVFFLDEDQRVTFDDIGEVAEIERWARSEGAEVHRLELSSQFRCSGSDAYLAWLDNTLQIRETANVELREGEYDFRVVDSPAELRHLVLERNGDNKSRMVAGYCWPWKSQKDSGVDDIVFADHGFSHQWNLKKHGGRWIEAPESVSEVGCVHTAQGLELDYVGVIVGPDLKVRDGEVITDASERASQDRTVWGYKKMLKQDRDRALELADRVIKNTYKTLMTRGMRGCYVYFVDDEAREFFQSRMES